MANQSKLKGTRKRQVTQATVPGKLILSGEHAAVYGAPALATTLPMGVTTTISCDSSDKAFHFSSPDLDFDETLTHEDCLNLRETLLTRFQGFEAGRLQLHEVLQEPHQLVPFVVAQLFDMLKQPLPSGWTLEITGDLPIGYGLGSSAAVILSVIEACLSAGQWHLDYGDLFALALTAEKLRHGNSTGLDLKTCTDCAEQGCVWFERGKTEPRTVPSGFLSGAAAKFSTHLINTGAPVSSTGDCVASAAKYFEQNERLVTYFAQQTTNMDEALQNKNEIELLKTIKHNHRLLVDIGVVPQTIQNFIRDIESEGGAAKISGGGSIEGESAGFLWAVTPAHDFHSLEQLCQHYHYSHDPIKL